MGPSVYAAQNQCGMTGLERLVKSQTMPDGNHIRLFLDHKGKYRIVAFKSSAHKVGYAGVSPSGWGNTLQGNLFHDARGWHYKKVTGPIDSLADTLVSFPASDNGRRSLL